MFFASEWSRFTANSTRAINDCQLDNIEPADPTDERNGTYLATLQVYADGARTRFVWVTDVLPDEIVPAISALVEAGAAAIRRKLERPR